MKTFASGDFDALLAGFAATTGNPVERFEQPGTTVFGGETRRGTGQLAWYRLGENPDEAVHTFLWCDPDVVDRVVDLASPDEALPLAAFQAAAAKLGAALLGSGVMRTLRAPLSVDLTEPSVVERDGLKFETLDASSPTDLARIESFTAVLDPDDVEQADLEDLTDFADTNILVATEPTGEIVAYASTYVWDWDNTFGDIGVLVADRYRRHGLGAAVVQRTMRTVAADGGRSLYRHDAANAGSAGLAASLGLIPAVAVEVWALPGA